MSRVLTSKSARGGGSSAPARGGPETLPDAKWRISLLMSLAIHGWLAGSLRLLELRDARDAESRLLLRQGELAAAMPTVQVFEAAPPDEKPDQPPRSEATLTEPLADVLGFPGPLAPESPVPARPPPVMGESAPIPHRPASPRSTWRVPPAAAGPSPTGASPDLPRPEIPVPAPVRILSIHPPIDVSSSPVTARPGVEKGAKLVKQPTPRYPPSCIRRGRQGVVILEVWVRPDGSPGRIRVLRSSSYDELDRAAVDAIAAARFVPATRDGKPLGSWTIVPVRFKLKD